MKKTIIIFCFIGSIIACNSGDSTATKEVDKGAAETAQTEDPEIERGLDLITQSDCLTCHKVADVLVGPSYEAIAAKYPDNDAVIDSISKKIITGGAGNWGIVAMTPHADLSEADAKAMTKYVLSLK